MRFTIILFLGLVLMTMKASGKPATYLVETVDDVDDAVATFDVAKVIQF